MSVMGNSTMEVKELEVEEIHKDDSNQQKKDTESTEKTCFIVMPISNVDGYDQGHFDRVYNFIIKPACKKAGFSAVRADDTKHTNTIILDILKQIVEADMVICDMSSKNPNVMYELGIRQAFNLPVVLLKDNRTTRIFDTSPLRDVEYDHSLRIDTVNAAIEKIALALAETYKNKDTDTHSLIKLLSIEAARVPEKKEVSMDTLLLFDAIQELRSDVSKLRDNENLHEKIFGRGNSNVLTSRVINVPKKALYSSIHDFINSNQSRVVNHPRFGLGFLVSYSEGTKSLLVNFDDNVRWISAPFEGLTMDGINIETLVSPLIN